ncbi:hypothetical protein Tco_1522102, partial [Tanacetum coccineum]
MTASECRSCSWYREDSNEATFAVVVVEKINAYETLTFNDTVACEVIPKWNAGLKEDMDARSVVYVLENGYRKSSDNSEGYYWEYTLWDCDVEKNGKWSYAYAVGSHVYHEVCTRPDITSAGVGMLDGFDHGLQTHVQVFMDFDYAMGRSIIIIGRSITRNGRVYDTYGGCKGEGNLTEMTLDRSNAKL